MDKDKGHLPGRLGCKKSCLYRRAYYFWRGTSLLRGLPTSEFRQINKIISLLCLQINIWNFENNRFQTWFVFCLSVYLWFMCLCTQWRNQDFVLGGGANTHTHTHICIYIYIYISVAVGDFSTFLCFPKKNPSFFEILF